MSRPERGLVAGLVLAGVAALLVLAPTLADDPPPAATAFDSELDRLPDGTRLLTDEPTGAIVMWAHPALDVPVHGYGDLYTDEELQAFDDVFALAPGWEEWLEKYRLRNAVLPADLPLEAALVDHGWLVEDRADGLVLLRDGAAATPTGHTS